ncbi:ankyrin repeat domain-containing protein 50 [Microdochium nivale]|nr:ankyrin repeat domain-containing protein 50 [Microdochium nivale]
MPSLEVTDILDDAIRSFRDTYPSADIKHFIQTTTEDVKRDILELQMRQEKQKSMLNLARFKSALLAFESLAQAAQLTQEQASFIWGPIKIVLKKTSNDDKTTLDLILNSYYALGIRIPRTLPHDALLQLRPELQKALAYMYHDILQFHADILGPLTCGDGWKRTFRAKWSDYADHAFRDLLSRFDQHQKLFKQQLDAQSSDTLESLSRTLQLHVQDHQDDRDDFLRHFRQNEGRNGTIEDISRTLNGHVQDYQDDRDDILRHIRQYEDDRRVLLRGATEAEKMRKEIQLKEILRWLSTPGVDDEQDELHRRFQAVRRDAENTCQWIFQNDKVLNWLNPETLPYHSILWVTGKMGSGKSVLASSMIDRCMSGREANALAETTVSHAQTSPISDYVDVPVFKTSYFYCREEGSRQNDSLVIYKSLLRQMLQGSQDLLPVFHEKKSKGQDTLNDEPTAQMLLANFAESDVNHYIVIDGIDSCKPETRKVVVNFLSTLVSKCEENKPGKVRLLLVSHDLADVRKFKPIESSTTIIEMDTKFVQADIELYLDSCTPKLKEYELNEEDINRVQRGILRWSDGSFLYAQMVMDNLLAQPTAGDILANLHESRFPADLASAYDVILDRLEKELGPQGWGLAKSIFGWLACCKRPLQWHEIQAILVMSRDEGTGDLVMDYYAGKLKHDVHKTCGSLVQVLKGRITFAHHTIRGHILLSKKLDEGEIECEMAIATLTYLSGSCFRPAKDDMKQIDEFIEKKFYSFQDYAASKWSYHLEALLYSGTAVFENPHRGGSFQIKLHRAAAAFTEAYKTSLEPKDHSGSKPLAAAHTAQKVEDAKARAEKSCLLFQSYAFHASMVVIWTHLYYHAASTDTKQRNHISIYELRQSITHIRGKLESRWSGLEGGTEEEAHFQETYGVNVFKCDRIACDYFYQGFETAELRDAHINRHERPYPCPVVGCTLVIFGFSTNKDCDKHVRTYHPVEPGNTNFNLAPRELMPTGGNQNARYNCSLCGKNFTRKAIRDDHVKAHYGERPHECSLCEKRFTRANDLRRHRKQRHSGRRAR